jgi:hypothetical protein
MKSARILFFALFSILYSGSLKAQVFAGGNFSLTSSSESTSNGTTATDGPSSLGYSILPKLGIFLSEKFAAGISLEYSSNQSKTPSNYLTLSKSSTLGFSPFIRYYAVKFSKFSVFGQGSVGMSISNSSTKVGGVLNDGPKTTRYYVTFYPGLAYDLNEKISLETSLNFLSFNYNYMTSKSGSDKDNSSTFNIGAGPGQIFTVGNITVGAIIKF